jgi:hypothetical protein
MRVTCHRDDPKAPAATQTLVLAGRDLIRPARR